MVELNAVQIGQAGVPEVGVALHHPDFFIDAFHMPEWASARSIQLLAQIVVVVFQRLLAHNRVKAASKRPQDERLGPRLTQCKYDGMGITHGDRFHSRKQRRTRAAKTLGWKDQALERRLDVLSGQLSTIVKFHPLAQEKRVGFAVSGNLPAVGQVWDDGLPAVARVP